MTDTLPTSLTAAPAPMTADQVALVPVFLGQIGGEPAHVCDGRTLHAFLENGDKFAGWITDRITKYGFQENQDFALISVNSEINPGRGGDRRSRDYHLGLDMAKELSMVENNAKGREARRYFITMERQALNQAPERPALPALITSAQAGELTTLVAERFPDGKHRPYAWSRFNRHFRLARYRELPAARFAEACAYIQALPLKAVAPLAVSGPIPLPIAHGWQRWLASNAGDRWVLREVPHDAFVMPMAQWPQVIRHEPVAQEDLLAVLSAIAERLSDKANSGGHG